MSVLVRVSSGRADLDITDLARRDRKEASNLGFRIDGRCQIVYRTSDGLLDVGFSLGWMLACRDRKEVSNLPWGLGLCKIVYFGWFTRCRV